MILMMSQAWELRIYRMKDKFFSIKLPSKHYLLISLINILLPSVSSHTRKVCGMTFMLDALANKAHFVYLLSHKTLTDLSSTISNVTSSPMPLCSIR